MEKNSLFDEYYYATGLGKPYQRDDEWLMFFENIAKRILEYSKPNSVLDAGCAMGFLVEGFRKFGVDAYGIDISDYAISQVHEDIKPYCWAGSICDPFPQKYDLITCIEVLEHMPKAESEKALANLCAHSDVIIFSSSPFDYKEATHFNVQSPEYWAEQFARHGFYRALDEDMSFVTVWAGKFVKGNPNQQKLVRQYEQKFWSIWKETTDMRALVNEMRNDIQYLNNRNEETERYAKGQVQKVLEMDKLIREAENKLRENEQLLLQNGQNCNEIENLEAKITELEKFRTQAIVEIDKYKEQSVSIQVDYLKEKLKVSALEENLHAESEKLQALSFELHNIYESKKWKLMMLLYKIRIKIFPINGNRVKSSNLLIKAIQILKNEGVSSLIKKGRNWRKRRKSGDVSGIAPSSVSSGAKDFYTEWISFNEPDSKELIDQINEVELFSYKPKISVLVPVFETPIPVMIEMIESVKKQTYSNWELCIGNASPSNQEIVEILDEYSSKDDRIVVKHLATNRGISENSNTILSFTTGEYVALLDHDDTIAPFALFEVIKKLNDEPGCEFIYSDKDMITEDSQTRFAPLFKPAWSPDTMLSANYLTHLCVIKKEVLTEIGGFNNSMDGAQDWDLFFRITEKANKVCHIPKVLYHWRQISTSVASGIDAKPYALQSQRWSIIEHLERKGVKANANHLPSGLLKIKWKVKDVKTVSVILFVEKFDPEKIRKHAETIKLRTFYSDYELIYIVNQANFNEMDVFQNGTNLKIIATNENTNRLHASNLAAQEASGDLLLFLDFDLVPQNIDWMEEFVQWLDRDEIGATGGMLINPDNSIAYTGSIIDGNQVKPLFAGIPINAIHFSPFGQANWIRNFSLLSIHCFMISTVEFQKAGTFSENLNEEEAMLELCQKLVNSNKRIVYTPNATFEYSKMHEFKEVPITSDHLLESDYIDPFFNPNLSVENGRPVLSQNINHKIFSTRNANNLSTLDLGVWEKYSQDASILTSLFNFSHDDLESSKKITNNQDEIEIKSVTWFLPEFNYGFYGGLYTIFRFANYLFEQRNIQNRFVILGNGNVSRMRQAISKMFPLLKEQAIEYLTSEDDIDILPYTDACIATLWTTAYYALKFNNTRRKFYFIQDFEPGFYPAGSTYAQAEATYRFGFYGITNTISLKKMYENDYGGKAEYFVPSVDTGVFYPSHEEKKNDGTYKLFFYGRPGHPRNAFELGTQALLKLKSIYGEKIDIITAGSNWDPGQFGLDGVIRNLGLLTYEETGELYRSCDLGLVMMFTKHPSYLPFELMACGCLVVTNFNQYTTWLLRDKENCLLASASIDSLVESIQNGIENQELRNNITLNAAKIIQENHSNWNTQFDEVYDFMKRLS